jgi:hypothetical protein
MMHRSLARSLGLVKLRDLEAYALRVLEGRNVLPAQPERRRALAVELVAMDICRHRGGELDSRDSFPIPLLEDREAARAIVEAVQRRMEAA